MKSLYCPLVFSLLILGACSNDFAYGGSIAPGDGDTSQLGSDGVPQTDAHTDTEAGKNSDSDHDTQAGEGSDQGGDGDSDSEGETSGGLLGAYFDDQAFGTMVLERLDPTVDFDWAEGSPVPGIDADTFSVRWTGAVEPRFTEDYTITTVSDDGVRLWLDGELVIDDWTNHAAKENRAEVSLVAGELHPIKLEYFDAQGKASIKLSWSSPSQPFEVIPRTQLFMQYDEDTGDVGDTEQDSDTGIDHCPGDPDKTEPGECGCGVPEGTCGLDPTDEGKIVYPFGATTAIAKTGQSFTVWFDAQDGQRVESVTLIGPYAAVHPSMDTPKTGNWVYDETSQNTYDTRITVTIPTSAPADRYDLVLRTSRGDVISKRAVQIIDEYPAEYTILHLSDTHLGRGTKDLLLERLSAVVEMANIIGPDIVFATGDNVTHTSGDFQGRINEFYDGRASDGLKGLRDFDAPTFVTAGNHDYAEKTSETASCCYESKARFWNRYYGLQAYRFAYGNARFMVVNRGWSGYDWSHQFDDHTSWLDAVGTGNLQVAACHMGGGGLLGTWQKKADLDLILVGHNHHIGDENPHLVNDRPVQYIAPAIDDYLEFNLFAVDAQSGTYAPVGGKTGNIRVLENNEDKSDPNLWKPNLTLTFDETNDGTSTANTATLVNKFDFAIPRARVRFVMAKGSYTVSKGHIEQIIESTGATVVDVRVDLPASSAMSVSVH